MAENKNKKREITTIAIPNETFAKVESFCNLHGMTKREWVDASIDYFIKNNIDPRKQTNPVLDAINEIKEQSLKQNEQMAGVVQGVTGAVQSMFDTINQASQKQLTMIEEQKQTIQVIEENTTKPKKKHWWSRSKDD